MEHLNPIIIAAIVVQSFISGVSHVAGAIAGYLITTGILIWGLGVYADGDFIALFGISLSQQAFLVACLVWYGFDTYELFGGRPVETEEIEEDGQVLENEVPQQS